MYERHTFETRERKFSTSLPIVVMLVSILAITAYLLIDGTFMNDSDQTTAVVLPKPSADTSR